MTAGLEKILNSPEASPLNNPQVFRQIVSQGGKSMSETLKYIGKNQKPHALMMKKNPKPGWKS